MTRFIILLFIILCSCNSNSLMDASDHRVYTIDSLSRDVDTSMFFRTTRGNTTIFMDKSIDTARGTVFNFDSTGALTKYFFITKGFAYSYSEDFVWNEYSRAILGSPIVLCNLYEKQGDSLKIEFIYSSFKKVITENSVTIDGIPLELTPIKKNEAYSFTVCNYATFKKMPNAKLIVKCTGYYYDVWSGELCPFSDSFNF